MNNISNREKGLLILAATVMVAAIYFVARVKPQTLADQALAEEVANLQNSVEHFTMPRSSGDPEAVKKQLAETEAKLKQAKDELDALFRNRADESSHQALEALMLEIMTVARAKGVAVDTSGAYTGSSAGFGFISKDELSALQAGNEPFRFRPLRSVVLRGGFPQIKSFIEALPGLKHEVNVMRFSFKADSDKSGAQASGLRAELVLAL